MKNKVLYTIYTVIVIMSVVFLASCTQPAPAPKPAPTPAPAPAPAPTPAPAPAPAPAPFKWPAEYKVATAAIGSTSNAMMAALGPAIEKSTGMKVRVVPEDNIPLKAKWLASGQFDAMDQSSGEVAPYSIQCSGGYATKDGGPYAVRGLFYLYDQFFGCFVKGDSGIKTIADLKGKRIGWWQVPGSEDIIKAVLAWGNLTTSDVTLVPIGSYPAQMDAVLEGKTDAAFVASPSAPNVQKAEAAPGGILWLDLDPAKDPSAVARFNQYLPVHAPVKITSGVPSSIGKWGWGSAGMSWTRAQADTELVYNILKWLDSNYNAYKDLHVKLNELTIKNLRDTYNWMYLPLHDGGIKFFKEKGQWAANDDIRQKYNTDLVNCYVAAYADCIMKAEAAKINIDPQDKDWQAFWAKYKTDLGIPIFRSTGNIEDVKKWQAVLDPIKTKLAVK